MLLKVLRMAPASVSLTRSWVDFGSTHRIIATYGTNARLKSANDIDSDEITATSPPRPPPPPEECDVVEDEDGVNILTFLPYSKEYNAREGSH